MDKPQAAGASRASDDLHNEDRYLVEDGLGLYVVCDGLGSAPGGEVAAYLAVEALEHYLEDVDESQALREGTISIETIDRAIRYALDCMLDAGETRPDLAGMASTITMLVVQRDRGFIGHLGDSRAYLFRRGRCVQLTADQEWTQDTQDAQAASAAPHAPSRERAELFSIELQGGDTIVLCTDGAEREVESLGRESAVADTSPRVLASRLVSAAHRRDPESDATVVVVRIRDEHELAWLELSDPPHLRADTHTLVPRTGASPTRA